MFWLERKKSKLDSPLLKSLYSISWSSENPKCDFFLFCCLKWLSPFNHHEKINLLNKDTSSIFIFSHIIKDKLMLKHQNCCKTEGETKTFHGERGIKSCVPEVQQCTKLLCIPTCTALHLSCPIPTSSRRVNLSLHRSITCSGINNSRAHAYRNHL